MAPRITNVDVIVPGKIDWKIQVRIMSMWEIPDYKNPQYTSSLEMVLLDQHRSKIHATIKRQHIQSFKPLLEEGCCYILENLLVAKNEMKLLTTRHQYKLSLMGSTKCTKIDSPNIPRFSFSFVKFPKIHAGVEENVMLDVIGHMLEKDEIKQLDKNGQKTNLIDFILMDAEKNKLFCTLWGNFADQFNNNVTSNENNGPVVVILHNCKLNKFNGQNGVSNAYNGTKVIINPDIPESSDYKKALGDDASAVTPVFSQITTSAVPLAEDLLQTARMTISDLIEAVEVGMCVVLAHVIDLDLAKGWCYDACHKCARKVIPVSNRFYYDYCDKMTTAVVSYKLNISVIDETGSATFVLFDRLLNQFLGKIAKDQMDLMNQGMLPNGYPEELDLLVGSKRLFKIEISQGNINGSWDTYVVKRMSDDEDILADFSKKYSDKDDDDNDNGQDLRATLTPVIGDNMKDGTADTNSHDKNPADANTVLKEVLSQLQPHMEDIEDDDNTPISKIVGKRVADFIEIGAVDEDETQASSTKVQKVVNVKKEPSD